MNNSSVDVILEDLQDHPLCPHGPTLLFSRNVKDTQRKFFACSAFRDRKLCNFFIWEDEWRKKSITRDKTEKKSLLKNINHRKLFINLNEVKQLPVVGRVYCQTCSSFVFEKMLHNHKEHNLIEKITDYQLCHPSEILVPQSDSRGQAQYLFSKKSVQVLVDILVQLKYRNVVCVGTPRVHEYISSECPELNSLLLDIDSRFHNFFGPLEFCWYNFFNHHFFSKEAECVFKDFLKCNSGEDTVLITDPPFGGRIEPLAKTLNIINKQFNNLNKCKSNLSVLWIFPYFMEPQILNSLSDFKMLDYKVEYENHPLFQHTTKGRKQGSPVRIFTNINPSLIKLPEGQYRFCTLCQRWVALENRHCEICKSCTSKDGRTYVHCDICERCVKPTWKHCDNCNRCALIEHKCEELLFTKECFNCKKTGHKKTNCPELSGEVLKRKKRSVKIMKSAKKAKQK